MILNIRVDHKTADISKMERSAQEVDRLVEIIRQKYVVREYIHIKTCNRIESYLVVDEFHLENIKPQDIIIETGSEALKHLLRLASGLESMIIGEDQILGQIKDAKKINTKEGSCGPILTTIFTKAVHVGQVVRKKTRINQGSISIGSAAVELAESVHGDLKCKKVLVIGAGKMGTLVAKALVEKKLKAIFVANRTHDRALDLARELGGYAIHFDELAEAMKDADVVISATGAPHTILNYKQVEEAVLPENLSRMVMVDIANPRDIDERVAELGVKLFNIDDIRVIADKSLEMRYNEAKEAENIVESELVLLEKSLKHMEVIPLISDIRANAEIIRTKETQKAIQMLGNLDGKEVVVDDLTRVVVDKIFHDIIKNLKYAAESEDIEVIKAAETIFCRS